jgi:uncharacterized membrane protein
MDSNDLSLTLMKLFKKERIGVDNTAFSTYLKSHPEYPQILSIANSLDHFNIKYGVYQTESIYEVAESKNCFLGTFRGKNGNIRLALVEHENGYFKVNSKKLSQDILANNWGNIALILEENQQLKKKYTKNIAVKFTQITLICLLIIVASGFNLSILGFQVLSILGIALSVFVLKDVFSFNSSVHEKVCKITRKTDCKVVTSSKKWRIFEVLDFSDLSFSFFVSQFILLLIFSLVNQEIHFFRIQSLILTASTLFIIPSLYYQGFVVKYWCPLCLGIMLILGLEFLYIFFIIENQFIPSDLNFNFLLLSVVIFGTVFFLWRTFKSVFTKNQEFLHKHISTSRSLNNYQTFKNILLAKRRVNYEFDFINFNNNEQKLDIILITDPFCEFCSSVFKKLDALYMNSQRSFNWHIIFNVDLNGEPDSDKAIYRNMMNLRLSKKADIKTAMRDWYNTTNEKIWLEKHKEPNLDIQKIDHILTNQYKWCNESGVSYTPALLINGFELPKMYTVDDLFFTIDELIEDTDF